MVIAVEQLTPKGFGRARMAAISDATAPTLRGFLLDHIEKGQSCSATDSSPACLPSATSSPTGRSTWLVREFLRMFPCRACTGVASLTKRWLLGTHQGAVEADHLQAYLNEFCFRFNRRSSRSRGMLFFRLMQ